MTFSLKQIVLCGLGLLPYTVYATTTMAFCKNGTISDGWWKDLDRCYEVKNWAEATCYATPPEFSRKGMIWKVRRVFGILSRREGAIADKLSTTGH